MKANIKSAWHWFADKTQPLPHVALGNILAFILGDLSYSFKYMGIEPNESILKHNVFQRVYEESIKKVVNSILSGLSWVERDLVLRCAVSIEVLKRLGDERVTDKTLVEWLRRVLPGARRCDPLSLRCLLEELSRSMDRRGVLYGLRSLARMALVERRVDPLDYAVVALEVSRVDNSIAEALAHDLAGFFDSSDVIPSELSYHISWLLVFVHGRFPDALRESFNVIRYNPNPIIACRALQLLNGELDAERIAEWNVKPCLVLARHKNEPNLYVIE